MTAEQWQFSTVIIIAYESKNSLAQKDSDKFSTFPHPAKVCECKRKKNDGKVLSHFYSCTIMMNKWNEIIQFFLLNDTAKIFEMTKKIWRSGWMLSHLIIEDVPSEDKLRDHRTFFIIIFTSFQSVNAKAFYCDKSSRHICYSADHSICTRKSPTKQTRWQIVNTNSHRLFSGVKALIA